VTRSVKLFSAVVPVVALALLVASTVVPLVYAPTVIVFDAAASNYCTGTCGTTLSWSHTVGSGSSRILVVGVAISDTSAAVASISYGSSSLTALPDSGFLIALYYLLNPAIGTATVTVTFTGIPAESASAGSISYFNVASVGSSGSNNGEGSPASITASSNAGDLVVDILSALTSAWPPVVGSGQNSRWQQPSVGAMSDKVGSSPDTTMAWTLGGAGGAYSGTWHMIAAVLFPQTVPTLAPVGGFMEPVNKLAVFAPYLALLGVIGVVAVVFWKRPQN
jgi:hypothetical protein